MGKRFHIKDCPCPGKPITAKLWFEKGTNLCLKAESIPYSPDASWNLRLEGKRKSTENRFPLVYHPESDSYQADLGEYFLSQIQEGFHKRTCWLMLDIQRDSKRETYRLNHQKLAALDPDLMAEKKPWTKISFSEEIPAEEEPYLAAVYMNANGDWKLTLSISSKARERAYVCFLKKLAIRGSRLMIWLETENSPAASFEEAVLRFRSKLELERVSYPFRTEKKSLKKGKYLIRLCLDLSQVPLKGRYWDFIVIFRDEAHDQSFEAFCFMTYRYRLFISFLYHARFQGKDGMFFYPYNTASAMLAFQYREKTDGDDLLFHGKEYLAWGIYHILKPWWDARHIRLVYEKYCMTAQDNGYYFFRYCMENQEEKRQGAHIYYVIRKEAPERDKVTVYRGHVIDYLSLKHMIFMQAADLLISTDGRNHLYPSNVKASILKRSLRVKPLVFLQHGVTAFKRVDFFYGKGSSNSCNLFVVTSEKEKEIVRDYFGYSDEEIVNSGFARWDVLEDKSQGHREILIMPTWRAWLENMTDGEFRQSDYFRHYMTLLNTGRLYDLLETYDLKLNFYLHSKLREFLADFTVNSDRIRLIEFGQEPANELLMTCRMLVTDYSSVSWDVLYQGKPVIFFQFDRDAYMEAHGSYVDMEKELFGDCAVTCSELLDAMEKCIQEDFVLRPEYEAQRRDYFPKIDDQNSRRICDAIVARKEEKIL
ncbi:MAG: CDP-glycerol glycerophosphotransferase family protein [Blautia sp.]|nr:CDP-glycerol glycerophosphotransferase family protein [Blautia sp.]